MFCQETFTLTDRGTISIQGDYNLQENIYDATAVRGSAEFGGVTTPAAVSWELNEAETLQLYSMCLPQVASMTSEEDPLPEQSSSTSSARRLLQQRPGFMAALACSVVVFQARIL